MQFEDAKDTAKELRVRGAALRHARKIGSVVLSDEYFRLWQGAQAEFAAYADGITTLLGARPRLTLRPARRGDGVLITTSPRRRAGESVTNGRRPWVGAPRHQESTASGSSSRPAFQTRP